MHIYIIKKVYLLNHLIFYHLKLSDENPQIKIYLI
jgi:hypothetical protein